MNFKMEHVDFKIPQLLFYVGCHVKLTEDLTKWHPNAVYGALGQIYSRSRDRFCIVEFAQGGNLEIAYTALKHVENDEYRAKFAIDRETYLNKIKSYYNVVRVVGPKGGFRKVSYEYVDTNGTTIMHSSIGFKDDAEMLIHNLKILGIPVGHTVLKS